VTEAVSQTGCSCQSVWDNQFGINLGLPTAEQQKRMAEHQSPPLAKRHCLRLSSISTINAKIVDVTKPGWNEGVPLAMYLPVSEPTDRAAKAAVAGFTTVEQ
jgi:hypothetical protein